MGRADRPECGMRITAKADYAVRAAAELAAAEPGVPVKGEALARAQHIPQNFLENILRELRRAGIIRTQRGADGGYLLALITWSSTRAWEGYGLRRERSTTIPIRKRCQSSLQRRRSTQRWY